MENLFDLWTHRVDVVKETRNPREGAKTLRCLCRLNKSVALKRERSLEEDEPVHLLIRGTLLLGMPRRLAGNGKAKVESGNPIPSDTAVSIRLCEAAQPLVSLALR